MKKLLTLLLLFVLFACQSESGRGTNPLKTVELITEGGETIETTLAITDKEQEQGLSGVQPQDFEDDDGMLFFYLADDERLFWMPRTFFDLDLFYLDKDLKVIDVIRKLPHYTGSDPSLTPRARGVWARHVLEMKSSSPIAEKIKVGDTLKWKGKLPLRETEEEVRKMLKKDN